MDRSQREALRKSDPRRLLYRNRKDGSSVASCGHDLNLRTEDDVRYLHRPPRAQWKAECWTCKGPQRMARSNARLRHRYESDPLLRERSQARVRRYREQPGVREHERTRERLRRQRAEVRARHVERLATDPQYRLARGLRRQLSDALKRRGARKFGRTFELVGCSPAELRAYLEARFLPGMTWENRRAWHIDHILPLASFDLTRPKEQRRAFHFTNLQPLWGRDNLRKSDLLPDGTRGRERKRRR